MVWGISWGDRLTHQLAVEEERKEAAASGRVDASCTTASSSLARIQNTNALGAMNGASAVTGLAAHTERECCNAPRVALNCLIIATINCNIYLCY